MIGLAEHARNMEPTVEGDIEQVRLVGIPRATRVVLHTRVEDHLGDELVSGEPSGGRETHVVRKRLAEAVIRHMRAHVSVNVEVLAVGEEVKIEASGQVVDKN